MNNYQLTNQQLQGSNLNQSFLTAGSNNNQQQQLNWQTCNSWNQYGNNNWNQSLNQNQSCNISQPCMNNNQNTGQTFGNFQAQGNNNPNFPPQGMQQYNNTGIMNQQGILNNGSLPNICTTSGNQSMLTQTCPPRVQQTNCEQFQYSQSQPSNTNIGSIFNTGRITGNFGPITNQPNNVDTSEYNT